MLFMEKSKKAKPYISKAFTNLIDLLKTGAYKHLANKPQKEHSNKNSLPEMGSKNFLAVDNQHRTPVRYYETIKEDLRGEEN